MIEQLITDHLDLWSSAVRAKSSAGRGSNSKLELTGIKKLRELILELAVRGKLVPQDPDDEPASVLLERIAAEKARLVKEGKIKKEKPLPPISEEEKPFALPDGWEWCRFEDIVDIQSGITKGRNLTGRTLVSIPYLSVANVQRGYIDLTGIKSIELPEDEVNKYKVLARDLLITEGGDWDKVGRTAIWRDPIPYVAHQNHVFKARILLSEQDEVWLEKFLNGPFARDYFAGSSKQTTNLASINKTQLRGCLIAVPPREEKERIVAKVDELMSLCDQLEQQSEASLAAHQTLVETLLATLTESADSRELAQNWARLAQHFDSLFTTQSSIDALKQTILQLAVMGKLVPQDPNDEPAAVLLERIAAEKARLIKEGKIKKEKPLPPISEEEKPFALPDGWEWARIGDLAQYQKGYAFKSGDYLDSGLMITKIQNLTENNTESSVYIDPSRYLEFAQYLLCEGDIVMTTVGSWFSSPISAVGRSFVINRLFDNSLLNQNAVRIRFYKELNSMYMFACVNSLLFKQYLVQEAQGTANQASITQDSIKNFLICVPPQAEQHRIAAKLDELMSLCDQLSARLQASQITQLQLAEALVEGALN